MSDGTHDTHDYEHVWPPYGVQIAEPDLRTASQRMAVVEHRLQRLEAAEVTA